MANYREIVTKAVIAKGKKLFTTESSVTVNNKPSTILGCWVINHNFNGVKTGDTIKITGSYDVNIWYSYDNNSKTNVMINNYSYEEPMNVRINDNSSISNDSEIIVRALNQPSVTNVEIEGSEIKINIESEMGVEVIGDSVVRVSTTDDYDDYEEIIDEDINVSDDYLK